MRTMTCGVAALAATGWGVCAPTAFGQAFSIDFGFQTGVPSIDFTAASDQGGVWIIPTTAGAPINFNGVLDITGVPTDVLLTSSRGVLWDGNLGLTGPEDLVGLVGDGVLLGSPSRGSQTGPVTLTFENMSNGVYEVYVYAWSPFDFDAVVDVSVNGEMQRIDGELPDAFFVEGVTHTRHVVEISDGVIGIDLATVSGLGVLNGLQIVPIPAPGVPMVALVGAAVLRRRTR